MRGLRLRQAFRSNASNIATRPTCGFASRAVVLSFVAGAKLQMRGDGRRYLRLSEVIAGYGGFDDIDGEFRQLLT
jgi:hypothetical protein